MKRNRRFLALVISLIFSVQLFALLVLAEGENELSEEKEPAIASELSSASAQREILPEETLIYVNPLYRDMVSPEDIPLPPKSADLDSENQQNNPKLFASSLEYTDVSTAAAFVRAKMSAHEESFTFSYCTDNGDRKKAILIEIMNAAINEHTGSGKEGDAICWIYEGYGANISGYKDATGAHITYSVSASYYSTAAQEEELDVKAAQILSSLGLNGKSEYEKVMAIYDYICENVSYGCPDPAHPSVQYTAYAALCLGRSVCQGYAVAFYRLCLDAGVDARVMTNHEYLNHAWNIARIGSLYYGIDTTWDVQSGYTAENRPHSYRYCLRGTDFWYVGHSLGTGYRSMGDKYSEPGFAAAYPLSAGDYVPGNAAVYAIRYHHAEGVDNPNPSCYNDATPLVLCEVSKPGYQFYGWYDNEGCRGASVPFIPAGAGGEKDFYACFMPVSYLIRFDGNGADSGSVTSRTAYYDESISLPEGGFVRRGYHFTGWNTAADGKGTDYEPGETVVNLNNGEPLTLYAKWEKGSRFPESGDTNGDGMVNGADVSLLARYVKAKGQGVTLSPSSGDTNGDGLHNGADIILLARYLLAKGHEITAE